MELILKKTVDNLGEEGDVVNVKSGFGRNYLLPQGIAVLANTSSLMTFKAPPVEPAEAPITIRMSSADLANSGQTLKSVVLKPVVVIIDTV